MARRVLPFSLWLACTLTLGACGGASAANGGPRPTSAFTDADAALFADGVDFVTDPSALGGGQWGEDWEREMGARIEASDFIGVLRVTTLRTDIDPEQRTTYRIVTNVDQSFKGSSGSKELTLSVSDDAVGYASVERDRQRILTGQFVAFVKWYEKADGSVSSHWHLANASDSIVTRVKARMQRDTAPKHTIIETNVSNPS